MWPRTYVSNPNPLVDREWRYFDYAVSTIVSAGVSAVDPNSAPTVSLPGDDSSNNSYDDRDPGTGSDAPIGRMAPSRAISLAGTIGNMIGGIGLGNVLGATFGGGIANTAVQDINRMRAAANQPPIDAGPYIGAGALRGGAGIVGSFVGGPNKNLSALDDLYNYYSDLNNILNNNAPVPEPNIPTVDRGPSFTNTVLDTPAENNEIGSIGGIDYSPQSDYNVTDRNWADGGPVRNTMSNARKGLIEWWEKNNPWAVKERQIEEERANKKFELLKRDRQSVDKVYDEYMAGETSKWRYDNIRKGVARLYEKDYDYAYPFVEPRDINAALEANDLYVQGTPGLGRIYMAISEHEDGRREFSEVNLDAPDPTGINDVLDMQINIPDDVIRGYAEGGPVIGTTGGLDDAREVAVGDAPGRLSDGEYVLRADIVAALGDGNTNAGYRWLDNWVQDIEMHKYGRPGTPPSIKEAPFANYSN